MAAVRFAAVGKTFGGTLTLDGSNRLLGRGCLLAGIGCRTQIWTRILS